jgi:Leucine-rich repeat (LRR) protein
MGNNITELPSDSFSSLGNLQWLDISINPFTNIDANAFRGLINLQTLYAIQCGMSNLNPSWFAGLINLEILHLPFNEIETLPDNVFNALRRLDEVYLGYNNLTQLTLSSFGDSIFNIEVLSVVNNQIYAIEDTKFNEAENLISLEMFGNVCSNQNFNNIDLDRETTRFRLRKCLDSFGPEFIRCNFAPINGEYSCELEVRNPRGIEFENIEGKLFEIILTVKNIKNDIFR